MNTTTLKPKELKTNRRAVAPIIATLLMVAIAVVGGTIIFVFAQGFFSSSQISGVPTIEAIKVLGYDGRDATALQAHDGNGLGLKIAKTIIELHGGTILVRNNPTTFSVKLPKN